MSFCTAINCMDGRTQLPVIEYLKKKWLTDYVDTITEPGPVKILAGEGDQALLESIWNRMEISVVKHGSVGIAVVGHHDCAGNPVSEQIQRKQLEKAAAVLRERYPSIPTITLWVDETWQVHET